MPCNSAYSFVWLQLQQKASLAYELAGMARGLVARNVEYVCSTAATMAASRGADAVAMRDFSDAIDK
jgi:ATP-dependent Zn protease